MEFKKITPSVKRGKWRSKKGTEPSDNDFQKIKPSVKKRDKDVCQFCGLRSERNEVHHLDDNHENNSSSNLIVACQLCHACHHIGFLGNAGKMAYSPLNNLSQADFNHFFIAAGMALDAGGVWAERAKLLLNDMQINTEIYAEKWGSASPRALGEAMLSIEDVKYDNRRHALEGVHVFFNKEACQSAAAKFKKSFSQLPVDNWEEIAKKCLIEKTKNDYDKELESLEEE